MRPVAHQKLQDRNFGCRSAAAGRPVIPSTKSSCRDNSPARRRTVRRPGNEWYGAPLGPDVEATSSLSRLPKRRVRRDLFGHARFASQNERWCRSAGAPTSFVQEKWPNRSGELTPHIGAMSVCPPRRLAGERHAVQDPVSALREDRWLSGTELETRGAVLYGQLSCSYE